MIYKIKSFFLFPLVVMFAKGLKGKYENSKNFITNDKRELNNQVLLEIDCQNYEVLDDISKFFDKTSPIYDKTKINFKIDVNVIPEDYKKFTFDFMDIVHIYHSASMLSARIPNENIYVEIKVSNYKLNETQLNNLLRYIIKIYGSKKVDKLFFNIEDFDEKSKQSLQYFVNLLNSAKPLKFSRSRGLFVLTCEDKKSKFDIVWSKGEDIELTEFGIVYDKFGNEMKKDIKVSNSPIVAIHKS